MVIVSAVVILDNTVVSPMAVVRAAACAAGIVPRAWAPVRCCAKAPTDRRTAIKSKNDFFII